MEKQMSEGQRKICWAVLALAAIAIPSILKIAPLLPQ